jgi:MFS family permease
VSNESTADTNSEGDRTLRVVALSIAGCAALFTLGAALSVNWRFGFAVAVGGAIAVANFLVLARIGRAITGGAGSAAFWGAAYFFKIAALLGGVFFLFQSGKVNVFGLLIGLSTLAPGIVVGGVLSSPTAPKEPPSR